MTATVERKEYRMTTVVRRPSCVGFGSLAGFTSRRLATFDDATFITDCDRAAIENRDTPQLSVHR